MRIGKERMFVLSALTSLIVSLMFLNIKASETSSTTIFVDPPKITVSFSGNFTVDISIENVTDLFAWQVRLKWNPQLLDIVDVAEGDFLKTGGDTFYDLMMDQSEGSIFAVSHLLIYPTPGVNGNGRLANVTFHCTGLGECILDLNDTKLFDSSPDRIPAPPYLGDVNGDFIISWYDLTAIALAFGTSMGDPGYDPRADFNNDSFVDLFDLLCGHFNSVAYTPNSTLRPVEITHEVHDGYVINVPVGGIWIPVNKLALLAPYIALVSTIILTISASVAYIKYRKKQ